MSKLLKFFSAVQGSAKGLIVPEELYRSVLTSLGSGTIFGLLIVVLQSILAHVSAIFPNPTASTLAAMLLTLILDLLRRQNQGASPKPTPAPASPSA